ncbi:cell division protein SepF [Lactiplantibacillus mudanjiangensis]|uniref:Cell division protein SepF n=1 Tax=Lactiplantibacillus mudanjiangensis TaxID=1296538 RepID=A0A660E423_9LACO|nr:cell division protein SepF [Lactiplantibacillus mudanjiangensis]VDG20766.1 cell division protein SepF [Lactobacillus sp.] [Lactiplantibacillus mudanjiangensis]VDG24459.1 cell division protein SepF [Lactobacillus sp.] [Lactiplantibacillus mudanjiangensis]VDG30069.1 cell division protein SepF [Lactobacillus sp.] [Lactiplantibacillus mudanjiangensis]VDG30556.1 cell division protein SepF [Lactobacillus sp.] [Lactiplantibacillus mudanjiangensis]
MAGRFSFNNFFGVGDEDELPSSTNSQPTRDAPANTAGTAATPKIVPMQGGKSVNSKIALFEPKIYSDVKEIASQLLKNQAVIVNFDHVDDQMARRIVDFLTGTVFAINGEIERIGDEIFLCIPENYEVSGSTTSQFNPNSL